MTAWHEKDWNKQSSGLEKSYDNTAASVDERKNSILSEKREGDDKNYYNHRRSDSIKSIFGS